MTHHYAFVCVTVSLYPSATVKRITFVELATVKSRFTVGVSMLYLMTISCFGGHIAIFSYRSLSIVVAWMHLPGARRDRKPQICWRNFLLYPDCRRWRNKHVSGFFFWHTATSTNDCSISYLGLQVTFSRSPRSESLDRPLEFRIYMSFSQIVIFIDIFISVISSSYAVISAV